MSDDLFFEGEEPVEIKEEAKKPAVKPKQQQKGGAVKKKAAPAGSPKKSGAVKRKAAPKAAPVKEPGFEFTPMVVMLIAIITLLVGFLGGLLAANTLLTPTINAASPPGQQMPPGMEQQGGGMGGMGDGGMGGGMGMGGGFGLDPMSEEELEQLIEEMREEGMPEEIIDQIIAENEAALAGDDAVGTDVDEEDGASNDADVDEDEDSDY